MVENWMIYIMLGIFVIPFVLGWIIGCILPIWLVILEFTNPVKADRFVQKMRRYQQINELESLKSTRTNSIIDNYYGED